MFKLKAKCFLFWIPVLLISLLIIYLSTLTWGETREVVGWVKHIPQKTDFKFRHIVQFAPLGIFAYIALYKTTELSRRKRYLLSFVYVSMVALLSELIQYFIPTRIAALTDAIWSVTGGVIGLALIWIYSKIIKNRI